MDEPPPRQLSRLSKNEKDDLPAKKERSLMAGEQGATFDVNESEEGSVIMQNPSDDDDEEIDVANLLRAVFPSATVVIAAHHASTLQYAALSVIYLTEICRKCDSIWILSKGKLVAKKDASEVTSQESLMEIILSHN